MPSLVSIQVEQENSEVCRIGATAGSGTNYESSYARLAIEKLSKR